MHTATVTHTPPPNPNEAYVFDLGLTLLAAHLCTGHEASARCTPTALCRWGAAPFCPSGDARARHLLERKLCAAGVGIFCGPGADVDPDRAFLADVLRDAAAALMADGRGPRPQYRPHHRPPPPPPPPPQLTASVRVAGAAGAPPQGSRPASPGSAPAGPPAGTGAPPPPKSGSGGPPPRTTV